MLVNGAEGIGTGWSTSIPNYNPLDVVRNIRKMLDGEEIEDMLPWYRNFTGDIYEVPAPRNATGKSFQVNGIVQQVWITLLWKLSETTSYQISFKLILQDEGGNLDVKELPVRKWTQDYKEWLDGLVKPVEGEGPPLVADYKCVHCLQ